MQFLPDVSSDTIFASLNQGGKETVANKAITTGQGKEGLSENGLIDKSKAFLESLNKELAASGVTPVVDVSYANELPTGFRTLSRDRNAKIDSEDISFITDKLKKRGVKESALTGIEGLLQAGNTPTIGNIMASVSKKERITEALDDDERMQLRSALSKLQLSQEDMESVEALMDSGRGHEALTLITKAAGQLRKTGFTLDGSEMQAVLRGLDLPEETLSQVAALFNGLDDQGIDSAKLKQILMPVTQHLADEKAAEEKLAAELKSVIDDALQAKKIREATTLVADTRGSRKADRSETRMRDDMTAKANGLGKSAKELRDDFLEEEAAFAEEEAAYQQREYARSGQPSFDQRSVAAKAGNDKATETKRGTSSAKDAFQSVIGRVDAASGMTQPAQVSSQGAAQNASTAHAHRQEIFSQVEQGMLRQLQNGSHQMTLRLDPAELGQISLLLTVKGGEVRATIRAESAETTAALSEQVSQLRASLEEQGLKVTELNIETQLPHDTTQGDAWAGTAQFNQEQEMREQARFLRLAKMRRESGTALAQDVQSKSIREEISASGLHIIA